MAHLIRTVTDPATGRTYPIPAGAADGSDGGGDGDGGSGDGADSDDSGTPDPTTDGGDGDGDDDSGRAGGPEALKADLARERQRRKDERDRRLKAERERDALRQQNESDVERAAREAREAALAPATSAMRRTAVRDAARAAGFIDPDDALSGVDLSSIDVDPETLEVLDTTGIARDVKSYAKQKPYLLNEDARRALEGKGGAPRGGADHRGDGSGSAPDADGAFMAALRGALHGG